jgi:maleylacetoacetate isomerase/maleylpyruvate isomerase
VSERTLYTFCRSSTSFRLRIALHYKGLPYTPQYVSLPKLQHRDPAYMDVNPQGLVPALIEDGRLYTQSLAMLEYLEERHPAPPLMPTDIDERAYVRNLSQIIGCDIHPVNNLRVLKYLRGRWKLSEEESNEWYRHWIAEGFRSLEATLVQHGRHGKFCLGERFTIADVCLGPQLFNAQRYQCDMSAFPTVAAIGERVMAEAAVQAAHPSTQADAL